MHVERLLFFDCLIVLEDVDGIRGVSLVEIAVTDHHMKTAFLLFETENPKENPFF